MKIFVGGIPWGVDNARLKEVFEEYGSVVEAIVVYDKETRKSRGFGFVTFEDEDDAERMIETGTINVDGRTVRIDSANEKRQDRGRERDGGREPQYEERHSGRRQERRQRGGSRGDRH